MTDRWRSLDFWSLVVAAIGAASAVGVVAFMKICSAAQGAHEFEMGQFLFGAAWTTSPYFGIAGLTYLFARPRPIARLPERRRSSLQVLLGGSIIITLLGGAGYLDTVTGLIRSQGHSSHMGGPGLVTVFMPLFQWPVLGLTTLGAAISGRVLFLKDEPKLSVSTAPVAAVMSAGLWRRCLAGALDFVIVYAAIVMLLSCWSPLDFGNLVARNTLSSGLSPEDLFIVWPEIMIVGWPYFAGFESSRWQATPGKMTLCIVVTTTNGERLTFGRATARHFGKLILPFGFIMVAFTERKQALHDRLTGTLVVAR